VKAPTLYHHFGSRQGLIDAVINHGFTQYVAVDPVPGESHDPVEDIRRGWDRHVQFGLDHPSFYALLYGEVQPGRPCAIAAPAQAMLVERLVQAARRGLLRVPPPDAAAQILAANVGVTLTMIIQPEGDRDPRLSTQVREAILAAVIAPAADSAEPAHPGTPYRATAAIALKAALDQDASGLSAGEAMLLRELLDRISDR
jgi:AcrR family transcriptional regulator